MKCPLFSNLVTYYYYYTNSWDFLYYSMRELTQRLGSLVAGCGSWYSSSGCSQAWAGGMGGCRNLCWRWRGSSFRGNRQTTSVVFSSCLLIMRNHNKVETIVSKVTMQYIDNILGLLISTTRLELGVWLAIHYFRQTCSCSRVKSGRGCSMMMIVHDWSLKTTAFLQNNKGGNLPAPYNCCNNAIVFWPLHKSVLGMWIQGNDDCMRRIYTWEWTTLACLRMLMISPITLIPMSLRMSYTVEGTQLEEVYFKL